MNKFKGAITALNIDGKDDFGFEVMPYLVSWDNGETNHYDSHDLYPADIPSELEEALARIDSLEELVTSLSNDRTQLLKAIKELLGVLDENKYQLDSTDFEGIVYAQIIYNRVLKAELE